jgi:hypothetical protein
MSLGRFAFDGIVVAKSHSEASDGFSGQTKHARSVDVGTAKFVPFEMDLKIFEFSND